MKKFYGFLTFIGAFIIGICFFLKSFNYEQKRSTASLSNKYDLTCLSGEEFKSAAINRVVMGLKAVRKNGFLGINIGNFTYIDSEAEKERLCAKENIRAISSTFGMIPKKTACQQYPKIQLTFSAEGEATNGEKRQLQVETPCEVSSDMSRTETAWIPWQQLSQETPFEGESQYNKPSKVGLKTMNISDQWPKAWVLEKIEMLGDAGSLTINATDIRNVVGKNFVFEFN